MLWVITYKKLLKNILLVLMCVSIGIYFIWLQDHKVQYEPETQAKIEKTLPSPKTVKTSVTEKVVVDIVFKEQKQERERIVCHKLEQLYNTAFEETTSPVEREAKLKAYEQLLSRNKDIRCLEEMLNRKGYGECFVEWLTGEKMRIIFQKDLKEEEVLNISELVKEITGVNPENLLLKCR